ncbi:MAG TPA: phage holin family protein [Aggregicoccus sp.]|nr:phage holin family protein [Aggregicoccus sp.]
METHNPRSRSYRVVNDGDGERTIPVEGFRAEGDLDERPLKTVVSEFLDQGKQLLRAELKLARTELRAEAKKATAGSGMLAAGGVVLLLGAMALVAFLVIALAYVMPLWASALLVTVLLLAIGAGVAMAGAKRLKTIHAPTKTIQTLKEDGQWASTTMRSAKSQMHGHA